MMDFEALVNEITARVTALISECKPGLALLVQSDSDRYHSIVDRLGLSEHYQINWISQADRVSSEDEKFGLKDCEAVILFDLTCEALAKIAAGISDSPYTAAVSQALLTGKRIFIPKEEIQLFRYKETASHSYYKLFLDKLNFLDESGVVFCRYDDLAAALKPENCSAEREPPSTAMAQRERLVEKRVVTEKDVIEAAMADITCLITGPKTIVTDLARDYAKARGITILKK